MNKDVQKDQPKPTASELEQLARIYAADVRNWNTQEKAMRSLIDFGQNLMSQKADEIRRIWAASDSTDYVLISKLLQPLEGEVQELTRKEGGK